MADHTTLLIGGTGFIGQALQQALLRRNHTVHILSRHAMPPIPADGSRFHAAALDDVTVLKEVLPQCDTIFLLASDTTPGRSSRRPTMEGDLNILPTLRFLETLQQYEHLRLIYVSSGGTVYGDSGETAVSESTPQRPVSYYGAGKVAIESFLGTYQRQFHRPVIILRPSNLYGPGQAYLNHFGLIRKLLEHSRLGRGIEVWGDGTHTRDYLFISDFTEACVRLLTEIPSPTQQLRVYNVGSGIGYTVNQLCEIVEQVTGHHIARHYRPARAGDVMRIVLDCGNIYRDIGWEPATTIHDGIERTWQWLLNQDR